MKYFKLALSVMVSLLFVQCDTAERRQSKAGDLIKTHLFETLDNFDSHELISVKLDTLKDAWLTNADMIALGEQYIAALEYQKELEYRISVLESRIKSSQQAAISSLFSGNGGGFWSEAYNIQSIKEEVESAKRASVEAYSFYQTIGDSLGVRNQRLMEATPFAGWLVTYKYRYTDTGGEPRIHTEFHILDPEISTILYSWDEDDHNKKRMINIVNDAIIREPGEWSFELATTPDEEDEEDV